VSDDKPINGPLSELEKAWGAPLESWPKSRWREAAEQLERRIISLQREIENVRPRPKRRPGRPRKVVYRNFIADSYFGPGSKPVKLLGRPRKYDDNYWLGLFYVIESTRNELQSKTAKVPTDKEAIEEFVRQWARENNQPKFVQRRHVARYQKLYSRAKSKIAKSLEKRR